MAYNGQKLIRLVATKMPASTSNTVARVPVITFVKYKIAMTAATSTRTSLSALPTFFFIPGFLVFNRFYEPCYQSGHRQATQANKDKFQPFVLDHVRTFADQMYEHR
jgi:hypothetical protein